MVTAGIALIVEEERKIESPGGTERRSKSLNTIVLPAFYPIMNKKALFSLIAAGSLVLGGTGFAASPSSYQVTGPIVEVNDSMITVMKGKEKFEVARDSSTKVTGDLKVGEKVTIMYTMTAKEVEVKPAKADKAVKTEARTSPSPTKK